MLQILTKIFSSNESLFITDPIKYFIALSHKLQEFQSLLKPNTFVFQFEKQLIPQRMEFVESSLKVKDVILYQKDRLTHKFLKTKKNLLLQAWNQ